jgi:hypothetical protein
VWYCATFFHCPDRQHPTLRAAGLVSHDAKCPVMLRGDVVGA